MHFIRLRLGKIVSLHAYLDTVRLERTLKAMADKGCEEAAAPPIVG